jgi:hypothetical protein
MRCEKVVAIILVFTVMAWAMGAEAHRGTLELKERVTPGHPPGSIAKADTIWRTGFEPGDPLGENFDYHYGSSPDTWHVTDMMLYHGTTTWMTAPEGSLFCHIGDDSSGYGDGDEVGYQFIVDLSNYSEAELYYLSAMQAYYHPTIDSLFDRFVVWGWYPDLGDSWYNLDPGEGTAWGGDWGTDWYTPEQVWISLENLVGHADVLIEFWFYSNSGNPQGFGVGIDDIVIRGTPSTSVEGRENDSPLPQQFALDHPYPNPFNAQATIRYQVPDAEVEMGIYNVRGQLVRTLVQGYLAAGTYLQSWDGRDDGGADLESGVYFCQLRSESTSIARKLVLLR